MVCKKWIKQNHRKGFSLIELVVTVAAAMILILGIGIMLAHSQQGFTNMYKRAHSDVVEDAYSARRVFDRVVRKSTMRRCDLISNSQIYVYYYSDTPDDPKLNLTDPDSCAWFHVDSSGKLFVDYSDETIPPGAFNDTLDPTTLPFPRRVRLAGDDKTRTSVRSLVFSVRGRTVRMAMLLAKESESGEIKESMMVTSSAVRHNK